MAIVPFRSKSPLLDVSVFVAPDAWVIGDVTVEARCSFFFGAVARGDIEPIVLGEDTNVQEHALLHTSHQRTPCRVGARVTIGHRAILHGCTVCDECIIGMGATVLDGAIIGKHCIVGAQTLIPPGMVIPERSLVVGVPAKVARSISDAEIEQIRDSSRRYVALATEYTSFFARGSMPPPPLLEGK